MKRRSRPGGQNPRSLCGAHPEWNGIVLAVVLWIQVIGAQAVVAQVPIDALVAYYPLDGTVDDASGHGHHGTNLGAEPGSDRFGAASGALLFDGVISEVTVPVPKDADDYTISLFVRADSLIYLHHFLLDDGRGGEGNATDPWIWLFIQGQGEDAGTISWNWEDINAGNHPFLVSSTPITIQNWHHVAIVREGTEKAVYVDGLPDGLQIDSSTPNYNNPNPITIGNAPEHPGSDRHFSGAIDDLYFFNRALTQTEVTLLYEQGGWPSVPAPTIVINPAAIVLSLTVEGVGSRPLTVANIGNSQLLVSSILSDATWLTADPSSLAVGPGDSAEVTANVDATGLAPGAYECRIALLSNDPAAPVVEVPVALEVIGTSGLVAHYPFTGTADDASGNCHHGTLHGGVLPADDRFGNGTSAYHFDGTYGASYIEMAASDHLDLQAHTISAWVKWEGSDTYGHPCGGVFNNGHVFDHYALVAGGEFVRSFVNYPNSPDREHAFYTAALADHEFHHIATSYNGSTRRLWLDGELVSEAPFSETIDYGTREACYIGVNFPGGHDAFKGVIDDVRVYDYALEFAQVESLYHEGGWNLSATIAGAVLSSGGGLSGVPVDIVDGVGALIGEVVTGADGAYQFPDLSPGDYTVSIITPLGYVADSESKDLTVAGEDVVCDFLLTPMDLAYDPRGVGFWKHQLKVYLTGRGKAQIDEADFTRYLGDISSHFTNSPANAVVVYTVNQPADHVDSLQAAYNLLNAGGNVPMAQKAKRQMMALLLNVASLQLPQFVAVSYDGATASQAITYCWQLVTDGDVANDELAKDIAEVINEGGTISTGVIPVDTPDISYGRPDLVVPVACVLMQNYPNPFGAGTHLTYGIPVSCRVRLAVHDLQGREVELLVSGMQSPGYKTVSWDAAGVPAGVYFCRLTAGESTHVRRITILR